MSVAVGECWIGRGPKSAGAGDWRNLSGCCKRAPPDTWAVFGFGTHLCGRIEPTASSTVHLQRLDTLRARVSTLEPDLRWSD